MSKELVTTNISKAIEEDRAKPNLGLLPKEKVLEMLDQGAILVDVRPPAKVEGPTAPEANIKNSKYIPITEFDKHLNEFPQDKPIIFGCKLVKFANRAMGYLEALGYKNVFVLDYSIEDFIKENSK